MIGDDRAHVLGDVLRELLAELRELLVDLLEPRAHLGRFIDARAPVVPQRVRDEPLGVRVAGRNIHRRERVVHVAIECEVRVEPRDLLLALARSVADLLVGMDLGHQARERVARARRGQQLVVAIERLVDRTCRGDDLRPQRLGTPQAREALGRELLGRLRLRCLHVRCRM